MQKILAFCVILVLLFLLGTRTESVHGGDREWNVVGGYHNKADAARLLQRTHDRTIRFLRYLRDKYHVDETDDVIAQEGLAHKAITASARHRAVNALVDNYNPDMIFENNPMTSAETSYTISKGVSMHICLRNRDQPTILSDENLLFFTHLHEMSHIADYQSWGHELSFWRVFKFILHEAALGGFYTPVDYAKHPAVFCGLKIDYQPLYDAALPAI